MRKRFFLSALFISMCLFPAYAEKTKTHNNISFKQGNINVSIQAVEGGALKICAFIGDDSPQVSPFYIQKKTIPTSIEKKNGSWKINQFTVENNVNDFIVSYKGKKLFASGFSQQGDFLKETKSCFDNELFYGIGQGADRFALHRLRIEMYQVARYGDRAHLNIPFFFTNGGDAFYYDANGHDTFSFRDKRSGNVHYTTKKNFIQFYYYYEKNLKTLVSRFYDFSGSRSLLPKWAYGYIQSRFGYKNEKEIYDIINKFEEYHIPISAIVLDLQWFKHIGDLDFDKENWPHPEKMDAFLEKRGIKTLAISEPFYTIDSINYDTFNRKGLFARDTEGNTLTWKDWWCFGSEKGSILNPIAPGAQELLGARYIHMMERGIDSFWTDLGEPEKTPSTARFNQYTEEEFHNYYNRQWSRIIYETIKQKYPERRLFILSRSGWTGSAKYGVSVWSGDVRSDFLALDLQATLGVNSGLTGFSYWGSDVGGFESGGKNPPKELFIRWMQFGAFSPVFRPHGSSSQREPWIHGPEALKIIKKYIELRYRLLPYIYSTAYQTYTQGIPMMRPMLLEHPQDPHEKVAEMVTQYYFGDSLLVAPVTSPLEEADTQDIYLPKGSGLEWYDFNTFEKYPGGDINVKLTLDSIPVFIKSGAIVPMAETDKPSVLLVPGSNVNVFTWFDDDGVSNHYKQKDAISNPLIQAIRITLTQDSVTFEKVKKEHHITLKVPATVIQLKKSAKKARKEGLFYFIDVTLKPGRNQFWF